MHFRRILLACSVAATASSVAFADLIDLNNPSASIHTPIVTEVDNKGTQQLDRLTKTLASGSYVESVETASTENTIAVATSQPIELNNEMIAKKYGNAAVNKTLNVEVRNSDNVSAGVGTYSWLQKHPLPSARVSSNFGGRTMNGRAETHSGLDLAAPTGTAIYATGPGLVTKSGWGTGYGQYVEINHGNGYITRYAHASRLIAKVGDRVSAGQHIANVGCTGRCTGPHLHYEVVKDGKRKNPSTYLAMLP